MATFGSTINPSLGRTDYSAIQQGANAAAQGILAGGQGIARGISQAGGAIAQGIKEYQINKRISAENTAEFEGAAAANPEVLQWLQSSNAPQEVSKVFQKLGKTGALGVKDAVMLNAGVRSFLAEKSRVQQAKLQSDQIAFQRQQQEFMNQIAARGATSDEARAKAALTSAVADFTRANAPAQAGNVFEPATIRSYGANGEPIEITVDKRTGMELGRGPIGSAPKYVLSPEEQALAARRVEEEKGTAQSAIKALDALDASAQQADVELPKYIEIENLLNSGTETGTGQEYLTVARAVGKRLGFSDENIANQQKLESLFAEDALQQTRNFLQGQGAVSNAERERVDKAALNASKDKNSLRELLGYRKAAATRALAAQEYRMTLEDEGKGPVDIKRSLSKWYKQNPYSAFIPAGGSHDFSAGNAVLGR